MFIPTIHDPSLAPNSGNGSSSSTHILTITAQYAPYTLRNGDWHTHRDVFAETILATLESVSPGIRSQIVHSRMITPLEWESDYGLTEGSIYQGQMGLDQMLVMRPIPEWSRYETPVKNLYLCGAGAHPGGGVTGAPGYNAARVVLAAR